MKDIDEKIDKNVNKEREKKQRCVDVQTDLIEQTN